MINQRSIKKSIGALGVGLHSGQRVELILKPASMNHGIVFKRIDLPMHNEFKMHADAIIDTRLASTIGKEGAKIQTIEHLMSACAGLGIDNLIVEVSGEEIPILDGSAASFVFLLQRAGIDIQKAPKRFLKILKPVQVKEERGTDLKWARLDPFNGFKLAFEIAFHHAAIDATGQVFEYDASKHVYSEEIGRARTFCFTKDVEMMREHGLALGGGLDNTIVMDDYKVINAEGLRYENEFVKHKVLDALGDLYVVGYPLLGFYSAFRSGHALNNALLKELMRDKSAYEIVHLSHNNKLGNKNALNLDGSEDFIPIFA